MFATSLSMDFKFLQIDCYSPHLVPNTLFGDLLFLNFNELTNRSKPSFRLYEFPS